MFLEEVETEDVFKDPDTIVRPYTWNDPTWRGILHLPQPIMCGDVLCRFICLELEYDYHEETDFWSLHINDYVNPRSGTTRLARLLIGIKCRRGPGTHVAVPGVYL